MRELTEIWSVALTGMSGNLLLLGNYLKFWTIAVWSNVVQIVCLTIYFRKTISANALAVKLCFCCFAEEWSSSSHSPTSTSWAKIRLNESRHYRWRLATPGPSSSSSVQCARYEYESTIFTVFPKSNATSELWYRECIIDSTYPLTFSIIGTVAT